MSDKRTLGREEEAAQDLPHTQFGWGAAWLLALGFALSIVAIPLWEIFAPRPHQTAPEPPFALLPEGRSIPEGSDFQRLEGHIEDSSAVWRKVRPPMQAELTQLAKAGNSQVVVGQDGWLFYRLAVEHLTGPPFLDPVEIKRREKAGVTDPDPIIGISNFANQLRRRGIQLIVMPVPVKAAIYPDKLRAEYNFVEDGTPQNPSLDKFKRILEERGIPVFDPTETLRLARRFSHQLQYFPTDTHWTPAGAAATGEALANFIEQWGNLPPRTPIVYKRHPIEQAEASDLVRLLGLPADQTLYPVRSEPALQVTNEAGWMVTPDPDADVLVLGDSFGGSYAAGGAGLASHLMWKLGRPVDVLTHPNGGSWQARKELVDEMKKGNDHLAGKKLVIYEFTARDLSSGNWIPFTLPSPEDVATAKAKTTPTPSGTSAAATSAPGTLTPAGTPSTSGAQTPIALTPRPIITPSVNPVKPTPPAVPSMVATSKPPVVVVPRPTVAVKPRPTRRPVVRPRPTAVPSPTPNAKLAARARRAAAKAARLRAARTRANQAPSTVAARPPVRELPPPAEPRPQTDTPPSSSPSTPRTAPATGAPHPEAPASPGL